MRLSIRTTQVLGVTAIVFAVVAMLGAYYVVSLAGVLITETRVRAEMVANGIFQRTAQLALSGGDLASAIATDAGLRTMLELSAYSPHAVYAAVVDKDGIVLAHNDPTRAGFRLPPADPLSDLVDGSASAQARALSTPQTYEVRVPLMLDTGSGSEQFGEIRVGVSTLLLRDELERALRPALVTAVALLLGAVLVATVLAQWLLRPILLLRAGLDRLGQGDTDVTLDFPNRDEFADLGESFNAVSARLAREHADGQLSRAALASRLAALGRVSSGIAHEVRNPLNAMRIHLELLRSRVADVPAADESVRVLTEQMRRLDDVVQGFLTYTRAEDLTLVDISASSLFDELLPIVRAEADKTGVTIAVDAPPDLPAIAGDRTLLHQALLNLALNACHAMPNGGMLRFSARPAPHQEVALTIEDTGTGIAPEHLEKIFNLYFTTKPDGSGIGLALVFRTIHLHNGDIAVQSVQGQGTTFTITLPRAAGH